MSGPDLVFLAAGLYLPVAMAISAWRRAAGHPEAVSGWVVFAGLWTILALPRWVDLSDGLRVSLWGLAWGAICLAATRAGYGLGTRAGHEKLAWLLGPMHALGLVGTWATTVRRRFTVRPDGEDEGAPEAGAREDVESVVELGETTVGEIMVPRSEIAALEAGARVRDWLALLHERPRHFVPVYREELDEISGYVRVEDLYARPEPDGPIAPLVREIRFVPESMRCDDLLRDLIAAQEHVAIVVDEFGGTAGLVTDQDLFEILLGEITRQDRLDGEIVRLPHGVYLGDGHCRIDDLNEWFPAPLPEGDYETLAGLVLDRLGRIPAPGERVDVGPVRIEVLAATERRVQKVRMEVGERAREREQGAARRGDRRR